MKLEDFLVMIGLKLLVKGYLENTLRYTTPFKNSENPVMNQALIYLSACVWCNIVPRVLFYPSLRSGRERDPGWVWSRGPRTKLIPREESFVSQFFCLVRFHHSRNDRKGKTDLLSLQLAPLQL